MRGERAAAPLDFEADRFAEDRPPVSSQRWELRIRSLEVFEKRDADVLSRALTHRSQPFAHRGCEAQVAIRRPEDGWHLIGEQVDGHLLLAQRLIGLCALALET